MRSAFRGPAHQLAVRMRINNCTHGHYGPSNQPCTSNCTSAEGLHFSAFHCIIKALGHDIRADCEIASGCGFTTSAYALIENDVIDYSRSFFARLVCCDRGLQCMNGLPTPYTQLSSLAIPP